MIHLYLKVQENLMRLVSETGSGLCIYYLSDIILSLDILTKYSFRTIVFIFIVISTTFRSICPPAFFRCLSNSGTYTELRTTSFIESTGSLVLIPWGITGYKCKVFLYCYSPVVRIEPATSRWLFPQKLRELMPITVTTPVDSIKDVVRSSV